MEDFIEASDVCKLAWVLKDGDWVIPNVRPCSVVIRCGPRMAWGKKSGRGFHKY